MKTCGNAVQFLQGDHPFLPHDFHQAFSGCAFKSFAGIGEEFYFFVGSDRQLSGDVKRAEAFYFVVKKLDAVRVLVGKRKHIDNAASNRKFSRLRHKIYPFKAVVEQDLVDKIGREVAAANHFQGIFFQCRLGHDLLKQGLRIGDHHAGFVRMGQSIQHLGAQKDVGIVGGLGLIGLAVTGRKKQHPLVTQKLF